MKHWWYIKRYKEEPIRIGPIGGKKAQDEWILGTDKIALPGNRVIVSSSISAIEESTEPFQKENIYKLSDGIINLKPYGKGKVLVSPDSVYNGIEYSEEAISNWYKKNIDRRRWDEYYSKIPSYHRLDDIDKSCWVAFRLVEEEGSARPEYLTLCTKEEVRLLDAQRDS